MSFPLLPSGFGIKGDEATYVTMAFSAAYDHDFAFEQKDLQRFWGLYGRGPEGIFLKRGKHFRAALTGTWPFVRTMSTPLERDDQLYFGKAFLYPLFAAPLVRLAGLNGFLLFHAVLLAGVFLGTYAFVSARTPAPFAAPYALAYLGASIAPIYAVWLTPEIFNFALVFLAYFLWLYKEVADGPSTGGWNRFLRSNWSDVAALVLLGLATYSKLLNAPLALPLIGLKVWRRSWGSALTATALVALVVGGSFGANILVSGELNYQGGERKTFYGSFPFQTPDATFDNRGIESATDEVLEEELLENVVWKRLRDNIEYFVIGRHAGLVPYYFPAVVAIGLCLANRSSFRAWHFLILAVVVITAGGLLFSLPFTWAGGGGPPGNRYFLSLYPLLLFLTPPLRSVWPALVAWTGGALFTAHILINPFVSSAKPWVPPQRGLLRLLPVEMTMVNDLPVMIHGGYGRVPYGRDPGLYLYFLDDNVWLPERAGIWVAGRARTQIIVRSGDPLATIQLTLSTLVPNTVTASAGGSRKTVTIEPGAVTVLSLDAQGAYSQYSTSYLLSVAASDGGVPRLLSPDTSDGRFLGVLMQITGRLESASGSR